MDRPLIAHQLESLRRCVERVHSYRALGWQIVHAIAHTHLEIFTVFTRRVHDHAMRST